MAGLADECSTDGPFEVTPSIGTDDDGDDMSPRLNRTCFPVEYITAPYNSGLYDNFLAAYNSSEHGSMVNELLDSDMAFLPYAWVVNDTVHYSNETCGSVIVKPQNYGSFKVEGTDESYSLILDPHNEPPARHALQFNGGNVVSDGHPPVRLSVRLPPPPPPPSPHSHR